MYIASINVVLQNNYSDDIIEIYNMYYLSGLSITTIAKRMKMRKDKITYILSDFSYRELQNIYNNHNKEVFEKYHNHEI